MRHMFRCATVSWLSILLIAGCADKSDGRSVVKGKLLDGKKPFVFDQSKIKLPPGATALPPGSRPLVVLFIPVDGSGPTSAVVNLETGTFEVPGTDGKGIKPGRYKIAVTAGVGGGDYFDNIFTAEKTQIIRDIQPGEEVVIDVSKPQG